MLLLHHNQFLEEMLFLEGYVQRNNVAVQQVNGQVDLTYKEGAVGDDVI